MVKFNHLSRQFATTCYANKCAPPVSTDTHNLLFHLEPVHCTCDNAVRIRSKDRAKGFLMDTTGHFSVKTRKKIIVDGSTVFS